MERTVFVFNPFTEGYIGRGKGFTPVKHQRQLAQDLGNLPQFLCQPNDVVLVGTRPTQGFLDSLNRAGFALPEFVELTEAGIDPADTIFQPKLRGLRPWAWGPDSVQLLEPLFVLLGTEAPGPGQYFNEHIARLYSKAWSAAFLRNLLAQFPGADAASQWWLCSESETGVAVDTLADALRAIARIRGGGHQRVVVKEAHGLAGHNAIRLWEPELLPAQRQWLANALEAGHQLVIEPWLERVLDFSVQLEMGPAGLQLCGYTGLLNDRKGQFLANWIEPEYARYLPARANALLTAPMEICGPLRRLYRQVFSLLQTELQRAGFRGPISIDALVYRTARGACRLKPIVEINPRYTMGRVAVELMKHASPGAYGLFRLVTPPQARTEGFTGLSSYADSLCRRLPLSLEPGRRRKIREGALCLTDPTQAQVCVATFQVSPTLPLPHESD